VELAFLKMQGCGEDVVVIDCSKQPQAADADLPALARLSLDRGFGIGGHSLLLVAPGRDGRVAVRTFDPRGEEVAPSGHALRCAARYASDAGVVSSTAFSAVTARGDVRLRIIDSVNVTIDLGAPVSQETLAEIRESPDDSFSRSIAIGGRELAWTPVAVGAPFGVFFVPDFERPLASTARRIARHPDFPAGTGIAFAQVCDRESLRLRAWEAGRSSASCDAAAAAVVAAVVSGFADREVFVHLAGGDLFLSWTEDDNRLHLTGPASYVFTGTFPFGE
jgi:diaminopimelate epimerase